MAKTFQEFLTESKNAQSLTESTLGRVSAHFAEHDGAIMTAWRVGEDCGKGRKLTYAENQSRNKQLFIVLNSKGYSITSVRGTWAPPNGEASSENSFIIIDINDRGDLEKTVKYLGMKYEQDSVLFKKKGEQAILITTNKCDPKSSLGNFFKIGDPTFGVNGEFNTKVRGRPFIFQ